MQETNPTRQNCYNCALLNKCGHDDFETGETCADYDAEDVTTETANYTDPATGDAYTLRANVFPRQGMVRGTTSARTIFQMTLTEYAESVTDRAPAVDGANPPTDPDPEPTGGKAAADLIDAGPIDPREARTHADELAAMVDAGAVEFWYQMADDDEPAATEHGTFWTTDEEATPEDTAARIVEEADACDYSATSPEEAASGPCAVEFRTRHTESGPGHCAECGRPCYTNGPHGYTPAYTDGENYYPEEEPGTELTRLCDDHESLSNSPDAPNVAEGLNAIADNAAHWTPEQIRAHALALTHHVPAPEPAGLAVPGILPTWTPPEGCTVIAAGTPTAQSRSAAAAIVLVERRTAAGEAYEYATGEVYENTGHGWGAGHYYRDENAAREDYARRMARGY